MAMASPAQAVEVGQRHRAVGHRHLPGADHLVAVVQAAHRAVADGDQEALAGHRGVAQHGERHLLQLHAGQVQRPAGRATRCTSRCILGGLPSSTSIGMSMARSPPGAVVGQHQLRRVGGHADHGERAALALAHLLNSGSRLGVDGQHVALLALVAPDLLGRQAGFFQRHLAQVEAWRPCRRRPPARERRC
jgi:hypothetical protein